MRNFFQHGTSSELTRCVLAGTALGITIDLMKIVHVVRQFHPAIGGLENVVRALAATQVTKGHDVRVVTLNCVFNAPRTGRLAELRAV